MSESLHGTTFLPRWDGTDELDGIDYRPEDPSPISDAVPAEAD